MHRMQRFDQSADVARRLGGTQVLAGLGDFRRHPGQIRRQHDHLALQARAEHRVVADASKGVATEVEQDLAGVAIRDPAHDECRIREEPSSHLRPGPRSRPDGTPSRASPKTPARKRHRARRIASGPARLSCSRAATSAARCQSRAAPSQSRARSARVGGIVERAERGLEAQDRHGAGPLLGDARQVARSDPLAASSAACA